MLDHQHADAQFLLNVLNPERHVVGFFHVQARGRLIKQQQAGLGTQGARHLHHLANTVGQTGHESVAVMLQVQKVDHLFGLFARAQFGFAHRRAEKQILPKACLAMGVATNQEVVQH